MAPISRDCERRNGSNEHRCEDWTGPYFVVGTATSTHGLCPEWQTDLSSSLTQPCVRINSNLPNLLRQLPRLQNPSPSRSLQTLTSLCRDRSCRVEYPLHGPCYG